jgi:hypothetical protein
VVHGGEGGDVGDEVVEEALVELGGAVSDEGLLGEHDCLGCLRVSGEETPVNETTISEIYSAMLGRRGAKKGEGLTWVVALLGGQVEHLLYHALGISWSLQEKLDNSSEKLELHLSVLILEVLEEGSQQL